MLFIVDSLYWVIGNFACQVTKDHSEIQGTTCSQFAIRKTAKRFGHFPTCFDIVHFLRTKTIQGFWGRLPIVTTFHHLDAATNLRPFHQSHAVMTVSSQWYEHLTKLGISENYQTLVPFGVNTATFHPAKVSTREKIRNTLNFEKDAVVLGISSRQISNADDRKGITCFLQAIKILRQEIPNLAILIIGPGWHTLTQNLRRQGISCTQAPYEIIHDRIAKFYRAMDLFWVTSRIEGGPVTLLEAMASGLPCISTPVGAALDLIKDNHNGFIVPFDAPELFVKHSRHLAHDHELQQRIGHEARNTILEKRQWAHTREKLQDLYSLAIHNFRMDSNQKILNNEVSHRREKSDEVQQKPMSTELFFSPRVQNWLYACEQVNGLRMMLEMNERKAAFQFWLRALRTTPFDLHLWREIMSVLGKKKTIKTSHSEYHKEQALIASKRTQ